MKKFGVILLLTVCITSVSTPQFVQASPTLQLTGQVISSSDVYAQSITVQPNNLILLKWRAGTHTNCTLAGPGHPKKRVGQTGITEVRAPQNGSQTYTLACSDNGKIATSKLEIITAPENPKRFIELAARNNVTTKGRYLANDIEIKPYSTFDLKWRTKGYKSCQFNSSYYGLWGMPQDIPVKLSGTSKNWTAPGPGEGSIFTLTCTYIKGNNSFDDFRVLIIKGSGKSDKG